MASSSTMRITLLHKLRDRPVQHTSISPDAYFDPLEDWEGEYECDSTPRNLRLAEYLGANGDDLEWVEVDIVDTGRQKWHQRREVFWNGNWLSFSSDHEEDREVFTEVIIELRESDGGATQLLKFDKSSKGVELIMHELIRQSHSGEVCTPLLTRKSERNDGSE